MHADSDVQDGGRRVGHVDDRVGGDEGLGWLMKEDRLTHRTRVLRLHREEKGTGWNGMEWDGKTMETDEMDES